MKLILEYFKKKVLNSLCGSTLTNTKIRNLIALHFINSIRQKSITGNRDTNFLSYDTMFTIYLPEKNYKKIKGQLIMIVKATTCELEYILKTKVDSKKFPKNYNLPHSPYWQFVFQQAPVGSKINDKEVMEDFFDIESETFPLGRDQDTKDINGKVSIRSKKSAGIGDTTINMEAFEGVKPITEGEYVVPFGKIINGQGLSNNSHDALLTLTIKNASFLVNGEKTKTYSMTTDEIYIAGKNANDMLNGVKVLHISDSHIMNPQVHISCQGGDIAIDANGNVRYRNKTVGHSSVKIVKGSSILINDTIQIVIS